VIYKKEETSHLSFFDNHFDVVIISNSILSENDLLNRRMLRECYRVLKKGGLLCGLFPSIFVPYEMALLDKRFSHFIVHKNIYICRHVEKKGYSLRGKLRANANRDYLALKDNAIKPVPVPTIGGIRGLKDK